MPLTEFHGNAHIDIAAPADAVFAVLLDVERLPDWNTHVHHVIEHPGRPLTEGAEWVIEMRDMGTPWPSRAKATVVDATARRFEHTSHSDDGNPSYALWSWQVSPAADGCTLTVTWTGYPRSFWRRNLLARIRAPRLAREVQASLAGLPAYLTRTGPVAGFGRG
ncbi:MAG TPA: SRPBCC family protein [Jatrophihabitantaceae bacterium]|nr:SRPBCC family protein [Jatrophihabitantaceae bacterium]